MGEYTTIMSVYITIMGVYITSNRRSVDIRSDCQLVLHQMPEQGKYEPRLRV